MDEEQLIRLFLFSLHTLQSSGSISGELEQALHRHLDSAAPPAPSAALQQPEHQQLYFVASQWLLLYSTLECTQAASQAEYRAAQQRARQRWLPLVWSMLCAIPAASPLSSAAFPSASAVNLLKLDVAQRMHEYEQLSRVYRTVLRSSLSRADSRLLLEEAVVLFTAAPHLGRWDDMLQLGEMIESEQGQGWLRVFHESAKHRQDVPDYSTLFLMAGEQREAQAGKRRRRSSRHTEDGWGRQRKEQPEEEEKQPEGQHALSEEEEVAAPPRPLSPSSPLPSSRLSYREWRLTSCESRYRSVECSHPELQQQAERIYSTSATAASASSSPPAYTASSLTMASVLVQSGCVLLLVSSPLAPALCVVGLRGHDGLLRLTGWAEKDEGEGGLVTWREEYSLREEEQKDDTTLQWEGTRVVRRVRRKYAGEAVEHGQQVSVIWRWDVRMQLQAAEA